MITFSIVENDSKHCIDATYFILVVQKDKEHDDIDYKKSISGKIENRITIKKNKTLLSISKNLNETNETRIPNAKCV